MSIIHEFCIKLLANFYVSLYYIMVIFCGIRIDYLVARQFHLPGNRLHARPHASRKQTKPLKTDLKYIIKLSSRYQALRCLSCFALGSITKRSLRACVKHAGCALLVNEGISPPNSTKWRRTPSAIPRPGKVTVKCPITEGAMNSRLFLP